ncbi:MAG: hypothetical protein WCK27_05630 [Verrucomicrobiota bacterium]
MPRHTIEFQTIRSEGGLLPPDLLRRIVDPTGKVPGVEPTAYGLPEGERLTEAITQSWKRLRRHWADFRAAVPPSPLDPRPSSPSDPATGLTNDKWSLPLLRELGFGFLATSAAPAIDGKTYAISRFSGNTALHLVGCGVSLDRRAAGVRGAAQSNPHGLVQEFLNRSTAHLWAIVSNGLSLRILRDNQALSRQSFLEFDLEAMFDGEVYSDFVLLWLIAHATRFLPRNDGRPDSCWLETWSKEAAEQGVAALTDLRGGVEKALQILGQGFVSHPKNTALREALRKGEVKLSDFHGQLLRIVYRLIFLFVAEDRELEGISLLHPPFDAWNEGRGTSSARPKGSPSPPAAGGEGRGEVGTPRSAFDAARERYTAHYSTTRLRELASRIKGSRHGDLWRQFQFIVGALSGDGRFAALRSALALPSLGSMLWNPASTALLNGPGLTLSSGLGEGELPSPVHQSPAAPKPGEGESTINRFAALTLSSGRGLGEGELPSPVQQLSTPNHQLSEGTELANVDFLEALRHLAFIRKDKILRPVDYKNLGSPEFGGVYESFLALTPQIIGDGARFTFAEFAGNERKTSGSYYTPDSLVQCLLDSALDPVVQERLADAERLAKSDWAAVEKEIQSDPVKRNYVLAFLIKRAGAARGATGAELKRAWDSIPPALRRWQISEEAILAIKVCDKACGSGHFLVGAAHRLARHLARVRALAQGESEPSPLLYQTALRDVIGHCLYGVDINPMAVELCKVTLWLEALEPGKPLSFLDHHIRCGNSLLGATPELIRGGIPDEAYAAIEGDDKEACSALKKQNKRENPKLGEWFIADEAAIRDKLFHAAAAIDEMSDNRPEDILRKETAFRAAQANYDFDKAWTLANLWCAALVIKKRFPASASEISHFKSEVVASLEAQPLATQGGLFGGTEELPKAKGRKPSTLNHPPSTPPIGITTQHLRDFVEGGPLPDGLLVEAKRLADQYQFFHWHLAFPEVFAQGGFDLNLGNPPWDMQEVKDNEFFAATFPEILSVKSAKDKAAVLTRIRASEPALWQSYQEYVRVTYGQRHFMASSGRFPLAATGRMNLYRLFLETGHTLVGPTGRVGIVLPSGFASDSFSQDHFAALHGGGRLVSLYDFENRLGLFPGVHSSYRFCLLTVGGEGARAETDFVFYAHSVSDLADADRHVWLSQKAVSALNPLSRTAPLFRSRQDYALTLRMQKAGPNIGSSDGERPWRIKPALMFMMNADMKGHRTAEELEAAGCRLNGNCYVNDQEVWLPFYEGKMVGMYDHRAASIRFDPTNRVRRNQPVALSQGDHQDPAQLALPMFWVNAATVAERCGGLPRWCLTIKDVTSSTNERTAIAAMLAGVALTHSAPCLLTPQKASMAACLLSNLNALPFDYVARQKVAGLHLYGHYLTQLPVISLLAFEASCPWAAGAGQLSDWILPRVLELTYTAWDLEAFAQDCDWSGPPFRWDEERRFLLRCELDAAFFHLYLGPETEWRQQPEALTKAFPTPRHAVDYIMDTFPIVKRKDEARTAEKDAAGEVTKPGRYITKDTILAIYDALAESMQTGKAYQTRLDPPPADRRCCHPPKQAPIPAPTWMDRSLALSTSRRVILTPDRYRAAVVPHLLYQAGGRISFDRFRKAYWLLTEPKILERYASNTVGEIARKWSRTFGETLQKDMFIPHLQGAVGRQLHFVQKNGERWLELRDPKVADDEHVIFDARLAILVADIWPLTEPITPLAPAEEITIQELEAVL